MRRLLVKPVIVVIIVLVALMLGWGVGAAFLLGLFAASVSGLIDGRWTVAAGLCLLALCPLLLLFDKTAWLQQSSLLNYYVVNTFGGSVYNPTDAVNGIAITAYYFLCIGVATRIVAPIVTSSRKQRNNARQTAAHEDLYRF
jgi:hypothetical protein